tara:strand:+ start:14606 stop:14818 length:213 start_codon:yes stop_codon:yes gene_type:complete
MPVLSDQLEASVTFLGMEITLTMIPMGRWTLVTQSDHILNIDKRLERGKISSIANFLFFVTGHLASCYTY